MERQAAESGIHLECPHILMWIQADAPELQRRSWLHEVEERYRALGADMWGALSEDGFLLALEADDLFALALPSPVLRIGGEHFRKTPFCLR